MMDGPDRGTQPLLAWLGAGVAVIGGLFGGTLFWAGCSEGVPPGAATTSCDAVGQGPEGLGFWFIPLTAAVLAFVGARLTPRRSAITAVGATLLAELAIYVVVLVVITSD
jgi:hypothetical protein